MDNRLLFRTVLVSALLVIDAVMLFRGGIHLAPDSMTYHRLASQLIDLNWNPFAFADAVESTLTPWLRISFVALTALCIKLGSDNWSGCIVLLNFCFSAVGYWLMFANLKNVKSLVVAFCLLILAADFRMWNGYALSDIVFAVSCFGTLTLLCHVLRSARKAYIFPLIGLLAFTLTLRPTGLPLLATVALAVIGTRLIRKRQNGFQMAMAALALCTMLGLLLVGMAAYMIASYSELPGALNFLRQNYLSGVVIHDRPYTYVLPPKDLLDFVYLTFRRFFYFFVFVSKDFSFLHNLLSCMFYVPLYCLAFLSVRRIWRLPTGADVDGQKVFVLVMTSAVLMFACYHALTLIDYDWRYRASVILPLIAIGTHALATKSYSQMASQEINANSSVFPLSFLWKALLAYIAFYVFFPAKLATLLHRIRGVRFECWSSNYIAFNVMLDTNYPELIFIEKGAWLTRGSCILTHFNPTPTLRSIVGPLRTGPVRIGKGAFIGVNSIILPNVSIGTCAIVGAGSVVTKNVPDFAVVAGNPARIVKYIEKPS